MNKEARFRKIIDGIKSVKIQGANNIAKAALEAYSLFPNENTVRKLSSLRSTEPLVFNVLRKIKNTSKEKILSYLENSQQKINENIFRIIENGDVIFTHCHSTTVVKALIYAKKKGKRFQVYSTETRPLLQGRKTANDLVKNGINVEMFVDSAAMILFSGKQGVKKPSKFIIGADALTKEGVVNKIGSGMFAKMANENKIPVFIVSNSWKFTNERLKIEQRSYDEVWKEAPKNLKIKNFAFEQIDKKYITKIISELGVMSYNEFLNKN